MIHVLLFLILLIMPLEVQAEPQSLFDEPEVGEIGSILENPLPRQQRFRGYNAYRRQFSTICEYLARDGRQEAMHELLEQGLELSGENSCRNCIEFFRAFSRPCVPRPRFIRPGEAAEPGSVKYREPNTKAIDTISRLFIALSEDEEVANETAHSLQYLLELIDTGAARTPAEQDYFLIVAAYMRAPFETLLNMENSIVRPAEIEEDDTSSNLGSLFDY